MSLTATAPRYAVLALRLGYPDAPATYADYTLAGLASLYGRTYRDILTAEGALGRLTRLGPGSGLRPYLTVVPGSYPLAFTVESVRRLTGSYRLLTGHPGSAGYRVANHEVAVIATALPALGVRRGSRVLLRTDTALGAGYVTVTRSAYRDRG